MVIRQNFNKLSFFKSEIVITKQIIQHKTITEQRIAAIKMGDYV
jgi:hypothetical protein